MDIKINKSSRHSKITGDWAERLVLYWLSKYGFECAYIDHVGIDILARNPNNNELMGISVKSRSRNKGTEESFVSIPNENFDKIEYACKAFSCKPYFAIVVDERDEILIFIISEERLLSIFPKGKKVVAWKMTEKHITSYKSDKDIKIIKMKYDILNWW